MTRFSVILATRNRPDTFSQALASVLDQEDADYEVVVVNDGSDPQYVAAYNAIAAAAAGRARFLSLVPRPNGHGQSYAINFGVEQASGDYVCFLDDDDIWIDPRHLHRADKAISLSGGLDLYMADQVAFCNGIPKPPPIWIEDLLARAPGLEGPDEAGSYAVVQSALLQASGFCHLNTTIVRRSFFQELKGLDEGIRYENDRDFYLRAIDRAEAIRYAPFYVSRHNVPVASLAVNMSTKLNYAEKRLCQLRVLDRQIVSAARPEIRQYARRHKGYTLQRFAEELDREGRLRAAAAYARQAVALRPSPSALATSIRCSVRSLLSGAKSA